MTSRRSREAELRRQLRYQTEFGNEELREHGAGGAVIGVAVAHVGADDVGGVPFADQETESSEGGIGLGVEELAEALVGPAEESGVGGRDAESLECGQGFLAPHLGPLLAVGGIQTPAPGKESLWPRIVFTVGEIDNEDGGAGFDGSLQQDSASERFVVGMRREN